MIEMFNDVSPFESQIKTLLDIYSLPELFDILDITPEQVLTILLEEGHAEVPPFLLDTNEIDDNNY